MMARKKEHKTPVIIAIFFLSLICTGFLILTKSLNSAQCANTLSCTESLKLSVNNNEKAIFNEEEIDPPKIDLSAILTEQNVLGSETDLDEKYIFIDLAAQTLKAYEDETLFMEAKISTGKWFPTPTGDFTIWNKVRATKMSGGQGAAYYYLPNVPYVMFFSNSKVVSSRGFAMHGAYWHNNFGHPMSHGCVNMRTVDAQKLFNWTDPPAPNGSVLAKSGSGTKITIHGKAP